MNTDDFEKRLQHQQLREIPGEWRTEILGAAQTASGSRHSTLDTRPAGFLSTLRAQLSTLLWPCPQAWAGLAAVWVVILAMSYNPEPSTKMAKVTPPSPELVAALKEQRRLYLELAGLQSQEVAEQPKTAKPGPRSEIHFSLVAV